MNKNYYQRKDNHMTHSTYKLPPRNEVPLETTWNLNDIFADDETCKKAQETLKSSVQEFAASFQGKIKDTTNPEFLLKVIRKYEEIYTLAVRISAYVSLAFSVDMRNNDLGKWSQETELLFADFAAQTSFFDSELAELDTAIIEQAISETDSYKYYLTEKLAQKPYLLQSETEKVLAALSPIANLPYSVYETIKAQDMEFPDFEANGKTYPLSYVTYETKYAGEKDTDIRRNAFKAFSETLELYHNTNAALMLGTFTYKDTLAKLRGFKDGSEQSLFEQKSSRELYDRQIDLIMAELAPHMRKYAALIQKEYDLKEMHYADLLLPLDPDFQQEVSIEQAKDYISDAIQIMGTEYHDMIMHSFPERWIDFAQNIGKSTGGFCSGVPLTHPYILLNWSGQLSEVFTLAHELGHAAQDLLVAQNNTVLEQVMPFYLIESPSTFHELLLADSLLKKNEDPRFKRWVISSMINNTYFHNAVTHLLEGAFQRIVMDNISNGEQLSASDLDRIYLGVLKEFWGDAIVYDAGCEKTWMRQPHYYMDLYSYTYSASLVVSTDFYLRLNENPAANAEKWITYLKTGGPLSVTEHAKLAGVDLTTAAPLRNMIAFIGDLIDQLAK